MIAGDKDHTVTAAITKQTRKLYGKSTAVTDYEFPDRGHSLDIDYVDRDVADHTLTRLESQSLSL